MFKKAVVLFFIGLLSTASQAAPQLQSWVTSKGTKVIYVQADALPMLDIRVVFDAGSARDSKLPGLASFVNGMLTEGTSKWDADALATRVEDQGIRLGSGSLRDMAWLSVRTLTEPAVMDIAVDTLAKVIGDPRFAEQDIERLRQQMLIGLRQSLQSPGTVAARRFYRTLYGDHPYAHPSSGTEKSLQKISKQDLGLFHRTHYVAANAVIAMVGAVDRKTAEALAERVTEGMQRGQAAPALPEVALVKGGELRQSFPSSQSHIYVGQKGVTRQDPDYFPLYVGNHILGGSGLVSVLGEEVRNKRGLSYSVYSYFSPMRVAGPFLMVAQTKNARATQALEVMQQVLKKFITEGPSQEQLTATKRNLIGGFPLKVASNSKIVEYISMIGFYDLPLDWLDTLTRKIEAVTLEQVRDAFQRRLDPQHNIAVIVGGASTP
jgi:zinc protease